MKRRAPLRVLALSVAVLMLIIAGCSSSKKQPSSGGDTSSDTLKDFELVIASASDPVDLDPRKTWVGPGYSMNAHIFEPLVFRKINGDKMELYGLLAESWKNVDPLTWEFKIRQGVKFHNGETLDAAAAAYTINSLMEKDFVTNLKTWTNDIASVEAKDASTLVIKTKYQTRSLLNSLAQIPIVAPKAAKDQGPAEFNKKPIGTGPYKVVSWTPNSSVVVDRFDGYWGPNKGNAKKITFRIMPENATRLAALESGEVQLAENLPPDKLEKIKSNANLGVIFTPTLRVDFFIPNFTNKWMANKDFREALSLAVNRDSIVKNILAGTTVVANSISPPGTIGYDKSLPPYPYDLTKAKEKLKASGYTNDPIKVGAPIGRYSMDKQIGEAVAGMWQTLGVNVQLEALAFSSYIPKANTGAYDIWFLGQTDFTLNPTTHWNTVHYSKTAQGKYKNERMDQIIEKSAGELDDAKVIELYKEGQKIAREDLSSIPVHYEPQLIGISKKLKKFDPRLDEYVILTNVELSK